MENINVGTSPNSGTGDKLRDAFIKVVNNFDELNNDYEALSERVDNIAEEIDVDLSNYDTRAEVDTKIDNALDSLNVPTKTSDLTNDGDGVSPFVTLDGIPVQKPTLDNVLENGNTTNRAMNIGTTNPLKIDPTNFNYMEMVDPLASNRYALRMNKGGLIQTSSEVRVHAGGEGSVSLGTPSTGPLIIYNTAGTRYTRIMAVQPTANNTATLPNKSGTIAMTSDIPSMTNYVPEAPVDGVQYGRKDGSWTPVITGAPDPGAQNLQLVGTSGYKLITATTNGTTYGVNSVNLGRKSTASAVTLGEYSLTLGSNCFAAGGNSLAGGNGSSVSSSTRNNSIAFGQVCVANHAQAFAFGNNLNTTRTDSMVVGIYNSATGTAINSLFTVGNGTGASSRTNALEVLTTGLILAPDCSVSEIDAESTGTVLTTKQWVESKLGMGGTTRQVVGFGPTGASQPTTLGWGHFTDQPSAPVTDKSLAVYNKVSDNFVFTELSQNLTTGSIVERGNNGVVTVGEPEADAHATTKLYVDTALANLNMDNLLTILDDATPTQIDAFKSKLGIV